MTNLKKDFPESVKGNVLGAGRTVCCERCKREMVLIQIVRRDGFIPKIGATWSEAFYPKVSATAVVSGENMKRGSVH